MFTSAQQDLGIFVETRGLSNCGQTGAIPGETPKQPFGEAAHENGPYLASGEELLDNRPRKPPNG